MAALTPDQAQQQLAEATERSKAASTDSRVGVIYTVLLGATVALLLAAIAQWGRGPIGLAISMGVYLLVLGALIWWQATRMRVANRRWGVAYRLGLGLTMTLYVLGIIWTTTSFPGWAIFGPYCALVAVPCVLSAIWMARR